MGYSLEDAIDDPDVTVIIGEQVREPSMLYSGPDGYQKLFKEIRERDGECQNCEQTENLHAHHLIPRDAFEDEHDSHFEANLVTLCGSCHIYFESRALHKQCDDLGIPIPRPPANH